MSCIQAPDEEFEEYLRHLIGDHCTGDRNEVIYCHGITCYVIFTASYSMKGTPYHYCFGETIF